MFELAKIIVAIASFWFVLVAIRTCNNKYIAFLIFALWLRFFLAAYHSITYTPLAAGLSLTALASVFMAAVGFYLIPTRMFLLKRLLPFYVFGLAIIVSGLYNGQFIGLANVLVKWTYFLCITTAFYLSIKMSGLQVTCRKALVPFFLPISLQICSILLGESKVTDSDGQLSYIGGYFHESGFSMIIVGFMILISLLSKNTIKFQSTLFLLGVFFIYLTNYRTAILAVLPVVAIYFFATVDNKIEKKYRLPVYSIASIIMVSLIMAFMSSNQERFNDLFVVADSWTELIKAPIYFTEIEKDIFSGRINIWSEYIYTFGLGDFWSQLFGNGPESWSSVFEKYAHNTFVSYLYEYGYFGFISFILFNVYLMISAWMMKNRQLSNKIFFSIIGFLILNLATMPLWALEGMIVYAMLISITFANPIRHNIEDVN